MRKEKYKLYEERALRFLTRLQSGIVLEKNIQLHAEYFKSDQQIPWSKKEKGSFKKISKGEIWGTEWDSAWFHITGSIPTEWITSKSLVAHLGFGGEACIFDSKGCPLFGLTAGSVFSCHFGKDIYWIDQSMISNNSIDLWVEVSASGLFGVKPESFLPAENLQNEYKFKALVTNLQLAVFDTKMWHFMLDFEILLNLMQTLPESTPRRSRILYGLNKAIDTFADSRDNTAEARAVLTPLLSSPANTSDMKVTAVGHAHIDTGWLWPVRETIRKCGRTFASQINLLEKYPDYVFGASQAQHYQFIKDKYPLLYDKIKEKVAEGRWEIQGGMWVEADCNLISGESMVRQFLHGKNFFMDEFNVDVKNLWLPDVFGYSASMPQIMRKAGVDYFLTQKMSWNQFNKFPFNTFLWKGIDGSTVLTHFPPEDNYNSELTPDLLCKAQNRFKEHDRIDSFLSLFGIGDGGGGPKDEHIERGIRMKNLEGCPKVKFGRADNFFLEQEKFRNTLDTWESELYLELHRGTMTTQAKTKKYNRLIENKLSEIEHLYSCLPLNRYPQKSLDLIWKTLLTNQFHDIIPGSSITEVYKVAENQYKECISKCEILLKEGATQIFNKAKDHLVLFNTLSYDYNSTVTLPEEWYKHQVLNQTGQHLPTQIAGSETKVLVQIPPKSFLTLIKGTTINKKSLKESESILENSLIKYLFNSDGTLQSAFDKEINREIIPGGCTGNNLRLYIDMPNNWDAWDIDDFYRRQFQEQATVTTIKSLGSGPVQSTLEIDYTIGKSTIKQNISLSKNSKRLDFKTSVNWKEKHRMLRVSFPVDIQTDFASFDIQYGYIRRSTHSNNSWEMAQFEVVGQKFADLSNNECGVALLNNCKYGYRVKGNILDLNLLRSSTAPDPTADQGLHQFTYSLLPHTHPLAESTVFNEASMLNRPPILLQNYKTDKQHLPVLLDSKGISLEVIKKAEKENCLVIRLVETKGCNSKGVLKSTRKAVTIIETDLMEWSNKKETRFNNETEVTLNPFEIRTYKIKFP